MFPYFLIHGVSGSPLFTKRVKILEESRNIKTPTEVLYFDKDGPTRGTNKQQNFTNDSMNFILGFIFIFLFFLFFSSILVILDRGLRRVRVIGHFPKYDRVPGIDVQGRRNPASGFVTRAKEDIISRIW